jgi:Sulfotransferase family
MPIFRIDKDLHYYAHVPKCGGSSVEHYLVDRFGPMGLRDMGEKLVHPTLRWTRTTPVHIPAVALARIIPPDWIVSSFAVVRHPVRRLISAFFHGRDVARRIPLSADFNEWFAEVSVWIGKDPYRNGGHLEQQVSFIPPDSRIFRLEDGLEPVVDYLDSLAGNTDGPREIAPKNVGRWRNEEAPPVLTPATLDLVTRLYAEDFARFGYELPSNTDAAASLPDLPALATTGEPPVPRKRGIRERTIRYLLRRAGQ